LVIALSTSFVFADYGVPLWASLVLGGLTTYIMLLILAISVHRLLRVIVGTDSGYLPPWKVKYWGTMAMIAYWLPLIVRPLLPPEYLPTWLMRALGMRIGASSINLGLILDPEMITLGREAHLEEGACLSGHVMPSAERRVYRAPVVIGARTKIGKDCVICPGVVIGPDAIILPNSFIPPNIRLEGGKCYGGNPATEISIL
ncbi:MAG: acyltransferase, partial [Candidatus Thorarchaeota archaeon]